MSGAQVPNCRWSSTVRVMLEEHLGALQMKLPVALESHQLATVGKMVASGLGVSAVPALCAQQMPDSRLHLRIFSRRYGLRCHRHGYVRRYA